MPITYVLYIAQLPLSKIMCKKCRGASTLDKQCVHGYSSCRSVQFCLHESAVPSVSCTLATCVSFPAAITYLQGLSIISRQDTSVTCNFALGPNFDKLSCAITIDRMPTVYVDATAGTPPTATYIVSNLMVGPHSVRAQAVLRSDRSPVEAFNISRPFDTLVDGTDGKLTTLVFVVIEVRVCTYIHTYVC